MPQQTARPTRSQAVIPTMRCRDAVAEIAFLVEAFGATEHMVVRGHGSRAVEHAQIEIVPGAQVMLGSAGGEEMPDLDRSIGSASVYVVLDDDALDAHHARAAATSGATVVRSLRSEDYGGRGYSVKDPEGNIWSFGSYDPYAPGDATAH